MNMKIPMLLMPRKQAASLAHHLYGVASRMKGSFSFLDKDLKKVDADIALTPYLGLILLNGIIYFLFAFILSFSIIHKLKISNDLPISLAIGLVSGLAIFFTGMIYPKWLGNNRVKLIDRDLLFAARHLRVQTTAGVPLFDSLVSATHGYGAVSEEFLKIVTGVQAGNNLADALEDSAAKNPSYYYGRILWQMSNAVKAGTDIGPVLSQIVEFLSEEQRVEMRSYGAQLNTLAIMYLMACIIVPTIGLIFMMVISSFIAFPITDSVFLIFIGFIIFVQYMFIGLIESRRPVVAI